MLPVLGFLSIWLNIRYVADGAFYHVAVAAQKIDVVLIKRHVHHIAQAEVEGFGVQVGAVGKFQVVRRILPDGIPQHIQQIQPNINKRRGILYKSRDS